MAIDASFLDQLKKLTILSRRRVNSVYAGGRRSVRQGRGIEITDHREYFPGDDIRAVDWKIYARTERMYIKRYEEDKELSLHILVDASASMNYGLAGMIKFDYAGSLAAAFAYTAISDNDKFSLTTYSSQLADVLHPDKGKTHFFKAVNLLNKTKLAGETDFSTSMSQFAKLIKSRSFVVVFSDFLEPTESLTEGVYRIAKGTRDLLLVQTLDHSELDLAWRDDILFEDLEGAGLERTFMSPGFKRRYRKSMREHVHGLQELAHDLGIEFYTLRTDQPLVDAFMTLVNREVESAVAV